MELIKDIAKIILKDEIIDLNKKISHLEEEIKLNEEYYNNTNEKESYYNSKYPTINKKYKKNMLGSDISIDVRCFVGNHNNYSLPTIEDLGEDDLAIKALSWVIKNLSYVSDKTTTGLSEYWNFSFESLISKKGDCEDGAILLYDILRYNGIPAWKLRITAGYAINPWNGNVDGHAYLTYYSQTFDKWVALDWCYFPNVESMDKQPEYKDVAFYGDVWFSFNEEYCWSKNK